MANLTGVTIYTRNEQAQLKNIYVRTFDSRAQNSIIPAHGHNSWVKTIEIVLN